ncbi:hypothetical protein ABLN72_17970, partial [Mycobacterium tuberculosis]
LCFVRVIGFGCLTYKHPNTSTVFAFYRETLSRFSGRRFTRILVLMGGDVLEVFQGACDQHHRAAGLGNFLRGRRTDA